MARALAISILLAACSGGRPPAAPTDRTRIGAAVAEDRACSRDSECALVDDCCGCSQGGQRLAVRAERIATLEAAADAACAERRCAPNRTQHHSCRAATAVCSGGLCVPSVEP